ncbi:MAG TPA: serine/threonine-protein kinase, partial [Kofleriaceae bacterium]|nr:serine/threonine-protein kinase [Kofleriaceae bacterium]
MLGDVVEDRYLIEAELGEGAMGRVYRARHVKVGREVAIKVMHRNLARVPAVVDRFAREAMIAARLRHPNLVSVLDVGTAPDGSPLIVLELAPGEKLASLIDGPQPAERVLALVGQLLRGLEHAHAVGLVHRDLKPDNILVERTEDGREIPRIVDFGIAVACERDDSIAGRRITEVNTVIGTPVYMSPEQARAQEVDPRSDLFSLGVIAYELLAGVPPFSGESIEVLLASCTEDPPSMHQRAGVAIEPAIEAFVRTLMARRPEDRFQSAQEALAALEHLVRAPTRPSKPVIANCCEAPTTRRPSKPVMAECERGEASTIRDDESPARDTPASRDRFIRDTQHGRELPTRRLSALPRLATLTPARRRGALAGLAFAVAAVVAVAGWSSASRASGL